MTVTSTVAVTGRSGCPPVDSRHVNYLSPRSDGAQQIDTGLYDRHHSGMSVTLRPATCCIVPIEPSSLAATEREALVAGFKALADPTRLVVFRIKLTRLYPAFHA
jgi:hypothetical protein